ncbi:UNVERIFIED_CONTAM: Transcription factor [Sesamum angustifolium]|uniref:Transcription factor n=1 Tax=Sesamum angustifolium TaxID=2727405 RepID=A0AAW2LEC4_9LAMI
MDSSFLLQLQQDDELSIGNSKFSITYAGSTIWDDVGSGTDIYLGDHVRNLDKLPKEFEGGFADQDLRKKITHREIERQRRQEMSTLYASLRSVLPPDYLKGKRSTSDQIHEAAKYITYLQNNVRELGGKRDKLKRSLENHELVQSEKAGSSSKILPNIVVTVQTCSVGVEVQISGDVLAEGLILPLSRILQVMLEEGLVVVCCNWTNFDGRLCYVIQSEVVDYRGIDLQKLQSKLTRMINTLIDVKQ